MPRLSLNASQKTKSTFCGDIPVEWGCVRFKEIVRDATYGLSLPTDSHGNVTILKMNSISDGKLSVQDLDRVTCTDSEIEQYSIKRGDILFNRTNSYELVGKTAVVNEDARIVFASYLVRYRVTHDALPQFIGYWFNHERVQRRLKELATIGVSQSNINPTRLQHDLHVPLPPLSEQQKIADILGTWDEALEKLDAVIAAKERRKQALMQQLLTGKRRLPGFDRSGGQTIKNRHGNYPSDWSRVKIGDVTTESSVRADTTTGGVVLSCTKHRGLIASEEYFGKRVYAADTSAYKVARRGEFAYATNHIEEGSIGYQDICNIGFVSPIYTVFKTKDAVDDAFFYRLLKSTLMIHLYRVNTSASVDRRGSLRYGDFAEIKINLPTIMEQRAIAAVLDTADAELRLLRQQRATIDQQKRGLMQQLLTGKVRVSA